MHPNLFLKSHWQPKLEPHVFVIMPFSQKFEQRFNDVFIEAIENGNLRYQGVKLQAYKVNQQNTGDCLHTKILDGIAHSVLVLADISTIHRTKKNIICRTEEYAYRNANVMYEVGLALACRQQNEVIIIKDDKDSTPFDISSITYEPIDFKNISESINKIRDLISSRLLEIDYFFDERVQKALSSMTTQEVRVLKEGIQMRSEKFKEDTITVCNNLSPGEQFMTMGWEACDKAMFDKSGSDKYSHAFPLLLNKGLIEMQEVKPEESEAVYQWTVLGCAIAKGLFS